MALPPLGEHELLVFWVQVCVLLLCARVGGYAIRKIGQPRVIGELLAGVALGPSIAGRIWPDGWSWLFPHDAQQAGLLLGPAWIGIVLLLMATGAEVDLAAVRREGRLATTTSIGSLVIPLAVGVALGVGLPTSFVGDDANRGVFAAFIGIALAISSLPVAARILGDLGLLRMRVGRLVLAVAMSNDVIGWMLLGIVIGIARDGSVDVSHAVVAAGGLAVLMVVVPWFGPRWLDAAYVAVERRDGGPAAWVSIAVLATVGIGAVTHALGLEVVIGAFIAGIAIGRSRLGSEPVLGQLDTVAAAVFVPLFFAVAGLRVDLDQLADAEVLAWAAIICVVATVAKLIGSFVGAVVGGLDRTTAAATAAALNARGALEIVLATVGLSAGILSTASYTAIVVMALVTSACAAPMLRRILR